MSNELDRLRELAGQNKPVADNVSSNRKDMYQINQMLVESAKPDFADIDDDGDKEETVKKAAKDKEEMSEQETMREWANSVGQDREDRGHVLDQPEGETVDLSLRRYLDADPMAVKLEEDITPEQLIEAYAEFKEEKK